MKKLTILSVFTLMMIGAVSAEARLNPHEIPTARDLTEQVLTQSIQLIGDLSRNLDGRNYTNAINFEQSSNQLFLALTMIPGQQTPSDPSSDFELLFRNMERDFQFLANDLHRSPFERKIIEMRPAMDRLNDLFSPWSEVRRLTSRLETEARNTQITARNEAERIERSPYADPRTRARVRMVATKMGEIQTLVLDLARNINQPRPNLDVVNRILNQITETQRMANHLMDNTPATRDALARLSQLIETAKYEISQIRQ